MVLLVYRYVALMFCPFAYGMRWYVLDDSRSNDREITWSEATRLVGRPPVPSFWRRYGLWVPSSYALRLPWQLAVPAPQAEAATER
jgi:hypothetical protein